MRLSYLFSIQVVPCSGIDNSLICSFVRKSTWYFSLITSLSQFNTCPYAETLWRRLWPVDWIGSDSQVSIDVVVVRCCRGCFWYDGFSLIKTTTMYYFIAACNCHWHTHSLSRSSFAVVCVNRVVRLRRMQPLRGILMLLWCVWRRAEQESWGRVQYIVKRLYSFCSSFRFGIGVCKLENVDM